jgi:hypothetical protein
MEKNSNKEFNLFASKINSKHEIKAFCDNNGNILTAI